jgi:hypothetical protein
MRGVKEASVVAVGEESMGELNHWEGETSCKHHKQSLHEKKKFPYSCRLFGKNGFQEEAM